MKTGMVKAGFLAVLLCLTAFATTPEERAIKKSLERVDSLVAALAASPRVQSIRVSQTEPVFAALMKEQKELLRVFRTNSKGVMLVEYYDIGKSEKKFPDSSGTTWYRRIQKNKRKGVSLIAPGAPHGLLRAYPYYVRQGKKYAGVVGVEANLSSLFQKALSQNQDPICILHGNDTLFQQAWASSLPVEETSFQAPGGLTLRVLKYRGVEKAAPFAGDAETTQDPGTATHQPDGQATGPEPDGKTDTSRDTWETGVSREKWFDWPGPLSKTVLGKGYAFFFYLTGMALLFSLAGLMYVLYVYWRDTKRDGVEPVIRRYHYLTAILLSMAAVYLSLRGTLQYHGWRHALESAQVVVNRHLYHLEKGRGQFAPVENLVEGERAGLVRSPYSGNWEGTAPPKEGLPDTEPLVLKAIIPTHGGEPFAVFLMDGRYHLGQAGQAMGNWTLTRVDSHEVHYENASTQKRADLLGRIQTTAKIGR